MPSPNKHMQRTGMNKVQGRGRTIAVHIQVLLARVLEGQWPVADVGRWATLPLCSTEWHYSITVCAQNL
jgi:hypothetical protein